MMLNEQTARDKADKLLRAVLDAPLTGTRIALLLQSALLAAQNEAVEEAAKVADDEEEPASGEMPPEIIGRVLAQDTAYVECALIAAVRSTKKNISHAIRSLIKE